MAAQGYHVPFCHGAAMIAHTAILLTLYANEEMLGSKRIDERPIGRTAMQKLVYFEAQKIPSEIAFNAHYYGPFSSDLAESLARLGAFGYVREDALDDHALAYECRLTRYGRALATDLSGEEPANYEKIKDVVRLAAEHCDLRQLALAHAGKTHFLRTNIAKRNASNQEIVESGKKLGWNMEEKDVENGLRLLRVLKLA